MTTTKLSVSLSLLFIGVCLSKINMFNVLGPGMAKSAPNSVRLLESMPMHMETVIANQGPSIK